MLAIFGKLFFRSRRAAPAAPAPAAPVRGFYTATAPVWQTNERRGVYRGISGDAIATLDNLDQAITLQDTLNLANGEKPSRRLLDAIYIENSLTPETAVRPAP